MPRGSGFVHLNTPAAISYSPGQKVSLTELRQKRSREECVVLPHTMTVWRKAFSHYTAMWDLKPFVSDAEAEREGEGPILPPLVVRGGAKLSTTCSPKGTGVSLAAEASSQSVEEKKGIEIISHHKLSGKQKFLYPDHDGVLSAGVVPQVVISEEERQELEANKKYYIAPQDMTEDERSAFEELEGLWKSYARGRSEQGARHRAFAGTVVPGDTAADSDEIEKDGHTTKRQRVEPCGQGTPHESDAKGSPALQDTEEALDDALRLVDELLEFD
uniref:Uncharacterized protein TCIL3000_10_12990 n=1 Tax=Trypanosoma congolense (strain IL3000) TaxID=1068625 RepID=G0UYQ0_TRYCI|nr:unnamed protein product [Trypanosoma congolense IL3000]